jgi:hypothetical protein
LKFYEKHTQANAANFTDPAIEKFPFRIRKTGTDDRHGCQAKFHWWIEASRLDKNALADLAHAQFAAW